MKIDRNKVYNKLDGHCGYCGREITLKEMQVDHMIPKAIYSVYQKARNLPFCCHDESNLMPSCRKCNHYKRAETVEAFRVTMKTLHKRLEKIYINNVAVNFGMIDIKPFDGVFYFEKTKIKDNENQIKS
jgi:uncharacterized protein (TIGR02646 family)